MFKKHKMSNKFVPLSIPDIRGNAAERVSIAIKDNWVSSVAPGVTDFENKIAKSSSSKYALATITGSAALHLALASLGIGKGSKVIVPDLTFVATINAVIAVGATPVLVDINNYSWTLDINLTKKAIKIYKPDAIIVVHTLGHPAEMDEFKDLCIKNNVLLIEDAAGQIGAKYKGKNLGTIGDAGIFSFNGNKIFTTGAGGALLLQNKAYEEKAKLLYKQARFSSDEYVYTDIGFNYRMCNINASFGLSQINYLKKLINIKLRLAKTYDKAFSDIKRFSVMPRLEWAKGSYVFLYSLRTKNKNESLSLIKYLKEHEIEGKLFWNGLSTQAPYKKYKKILNGVSESLSGTIVSLPCFTSMSTKDQERVIQSVKSWNKEIKFLKD